MVDFIQAQPASPPQQQQQIIVIPQSMLKNVNMVKPILKVSPSTNPPKIGIKRSAASMDNNNAVVKEVVADSKPDASLTAPVRKRANLDHLSPEEKLMRRKLKNRVAAQNARDKKRARMDDMADAIKQLEMDKRALMEENLRLKQLNARLMEGGGEGHKMDEMPPSPPQSPPSSTSSSANPRVVVEDRPFVVDRLSEPAELTRCLPQKGPSRTSADGRTTTTAESPSTELGERVLKVAVAASCLLTCLASTTPSTTATTTTKSSCSLPLKKRSKSHENSSNNNSNFSESSRCPSRTTTT